MALSNKQSWTAALVEEVYEAFVKHPDYSDNDFITKLKGQMQPASPAAQQLMAEMLWALLLFPSNMKARTKAQQVRCGPGPARRCRTIFPRCATRY